MIRLSDYIANFFYEHGIRHVFMMVGGGAMHLNDALGKHKGLEVVFNHHEQPCAIAAEGYARVTGKPAVVNVTTGPGGLNTLTGVFGAWTDSIPMIVISGQVRYDTTVPSTGLELRQLGDQEYDIVRSVEPMTKYAVMVTDPKSIKYHLEKALYLAVNGRPGPVWLDVPMNVQAAMIDEKCLDTFDASTDFSVEKVPVVKNEIVKEVIERISKAERPVILVGTGVRVSGMQREFLQLIDQLKIPVVTAWGAHDTVPDDNPYYCGRPGTVGDRPGNFMVQNSDLLLVFGCRLNIRQVGYAWETFARKAFKIWIDIDKLELKKPTVVPNLPIHADLRDFIPKLITGVKEELRAVDHSGWVAWGRERVKKYPTVLPEYWKRTDLINPYCFMQALSKQLPEGQVTVTGNGSACVISFQTFQIKAGQRLFTNSGCAAMGYDLSAAIGACVASQKKKTICLAGDGSLMLNVQELAQVNYHKYPIKLFLLNNDGYHSIRQTQHNFFGEPLVGCDDETGLGFPDFEKLTKAFGIRYEKCQNHQEMEKVIAKTLEGEDPVICEVYLTIEQGFEPKASSKRLPSGKIVSRPLEDLAPFLPHEELLENMCIEPLPEK